MSNINILKPMILMNLLFFTFSSIAFGERSPINSGPSEMVDKACLSHEAATDYYSHLKASDEPQTLPPDFILHNLKMKENHKYSMGANQKVSSNSFTSTITVPKSFEERHYDDFFLRHTEKRNSRVKISCQIEYIDGYPPLQQGRSTLLMGKALGIPTISRREIRFPMRDERGNRGEYTCRFSYFYIKDRYDDNYPISFSDSTLAQGIAIADMVDIISRSGMLDGTICPAAEIYGEDQPNTATSAVL